MEIIPDWDKENQEFFFFFHGFGHSLRVLLMIILKEIVLKMSVDFTEEA